MDFWALIDQARGADEPLTPSASPEALRAVLEPLSDDEALAFGTAFTNEVCRLNHWRLWGAGCVIMEDMSGDSFHYFRSWLVGKGRKVVDLALDDPDALEPYIDDPEVENESLEYVALDVLEARGLDVDPREGAGNADAHPKGEPYDEDTMREDFPRLAARFG